MGNMDLWNKYAKPPEEALKSFDNGNFKGTDISPMWRIRCLTEEFGQCGIGWYDEIVEHWTDTVWTSDIEKCVTTHVRIKLYYLDPISGEWSKPVEGIGGNTMTMYSRKYSTTRASDEAYKMARTDALGNACRNLGIGGSVYWEHGYSKYENDYEPDPAPTQPTSPISKQQKPTPPRTLFEPMNENIPGAGLPGESWQDIEWRRKALAALPKLGLDKACMNNFGTDFDHTPVELIRAKLPQIK